MHEAGLMQEVLEIAERHARRHGATRIERLTLRLGPLAGVVPEALRFAFDALSAGTLAAGAVLDVEEVPLVCRCLACEHTFTPPDWVFLCPECGTLTDQVCQGREFEVASLEIADE
jgi:hydrogenase nickel incorporation protein HypA/HybF